MGILASVIKLGSSFLGGGGGGGGIGSTIGSRFGPLGSLAGSLADQFLGGALGGAPATRQVEARGTGGVGFSGIAPATGAVRIQRRDRRTGRLLSEQVNQPGSQVFVRGRQAGGRPRGVGRRGGFAPPPATGGCSCPGGSAPGRPQAFGFPPAGLTRASCPKPRPPLPGFSSARARSAQRNSLAFQRPQSCGF